MTAEGGSFGRDREGNGIILKGRKTMVKKTMLGEKKNENGSPEWRTGEDAVEDSGVGGWKELIVIKQ